MRVPVVSDATRAEVVPEAPRRLSTSLSGLPAIPPITVQILGDKTCWGCGAPATVCIRPLTLRFRRFYCHACAQTPSARTAFR